MSYQCFTTQQKRWFTLPFKLFLGCVMSLVISFTAHAGANTTELTTLTRLDTPHFKSFKLADKATLSTSKKIYIAEVSASFEKSWLKKFKHKTTKHYRNSVLQDYREMLKGNIKNELEKSGWNVVEHPEPSALGVRAVLKDLYITGPEKATKEHALVANIGYSSISIVVEDLASNPILAIEDTRATGGLDNHFIETDKAVNFFWFNRLVARWSTEFVTYLDMGSPAVIE